MNGELLIVKLCRDRRAAEKIYVFPGLGDPPLPTPHENSSPKGDTLIHDRERLHGLLEQLGIPGAERANNILCSSLLTAEQQAHYPSDTSTLLGHLWADGAGSAAARPDNRSGDGAAAP